MVPVVILATVLIVSLFLYFRKKTAVALFCLLIFVFELSNMGSMVSIPWINRIRYALLTVIACFYLLRIVVLRVKLKQKRLWILLAGWIFVIISLMSSIGADYAEEGFLRTISFVILALTAFHLIPWWRNQKTEELVKAISTSFSTLVFLSVVLIPFNPNQIHGTGRFQGIFINPNNLAAICVGAAILSGLSVLGGQMRSRLISVANLLVALSVLWLSESRAGIAAVFCIATLVFIVKYVVDTSARRGIQKLVFAIIGLALTLAFIYSPQDMGMRLKYKFRMGSEDFSSYRYDYFMNALELMRQNPWLGKGLGGTRASWRLGHESDLTQVHQLGYVTAAVETGILGAASLILLSGSTLWYCWKAFGRERRAYRQDRAGLLLSMLCIYGAYSILGMFEDYPVSVGSSVTLVMWFISGAVASMPKQFAHCAASRPAAVGSSERAMRR